MTMQAFEITSEEVMFFDEFESQDIGKWASMSGVGYSVHDSQTEAEEYSYAMYLDKAPKIHPMRRRTDRLTDMAADLLGN